MKRLFFILCLIFFTSFSFASEHDLASSEGSILDQFVLEDNFPILRDDLGGFNRAMHGVNFYLDGILVSPVARAYRSVLPIRVRNGVGNFFDNLTEPYSFANNILQGDFTGAGNNVRRFVVNSLFGFGFLDIASDMGHELDREDFGQTLAVWGFGNGGYIVLPFFGPNTLRSAIALAPDMVLDPVNIVIFESFDDTAVIGLQYLELVDNRASNVDVLSHLRFSSVDFYAAIKTIYWQLRVAEITK